MVVEKAPMLSAQERRALVGLAKTKLVKQIFVFGLNVASENKQSGSPPQYR
jgi:hypothetical protein